MFGGLYDTLISIAIIVAIAFVMVALVRYENARPYFIGLFCLVWFFSGVYSVFTAVKYYNTVSRVYGTLEEHIPYEDFDYYKYSINDFGLDQTEDGSFFYEKDYATSIEFDGTDKNYTLLLNDKPCENTSSEYGKLNANTTIHFYEVDGSYKCGIDLDINFTFKSNHIILRIDTSATQENAGLLTEYVAINGFELRIIEEVFEDKPILTDKAV